MMNQDSPPKSAFFSEPVGRGPAARRRGNLRLSVMVERLERREVPSAAATVHSLASASGPVPIVFGPHAKYDSVDPQALQTLQAILRETDQTVAVITSTNRTPEQQAAIMYGIAETPGGLAYEEKLYKQPGRDVLETYKEGKANHDDASTIIKDMATTINEVGPSRVSQHLTDPSRITVLDIDPKSIKNKKAFVDALKADPRIRLIGPPRDKAYHIEFRFPKKSTPVTPPVNPPTMLAGSYSGAYTGLSAAIGSTLGISTDGTITLKITGTTTVAGQAAPVGTITFSNYANLGAKTVNFTAAPLDSQGSFTGSITDPDPIFADTQFSSVFSGGKITQFRLLGTLSAGTISTLSA